MGDDAAAGGIHLGMRFGRLADPAPVARAPLEIGFRLFVVGDFGGAGDGAPVEVEDPDLSRLMGRLGAAVSLEVPNLVAAAPPALAVHLPIATLRDLDPARLADRVPAIATAAAADAPAPRSASAPAAPLVDADDGGALDRLLEMVDPPRRTADATAGAALSAFIAAGARPAAAPLPAVLSPRAEAQLRAIAAHPRWIAVETAWRTLRLLVAAAAGRPATRIFVCDLPDDGDLAALLDAEALAALLPAAEDQGAVVFLGAFGPSPRDLERLDAIAAAAERYSLPAIVTLSDGFFGRPAAAVAKMDNPGSLLAAPALAAWRGLVAREEAGWLFPCWNDVVLRPATGPAAALFGGAGAVLASRVLASLSAGGWPTEILGTAAAIGGLDLLEAPGPDGRPAALPVRAAAGPDVARLLGADGIACLVARPNRDQAWFVTAPAAAAGAAGGGDQETATFSSLPFRFLSAILETRLQAAAGTVAGTADAAAAAAIDAAVRGLVEASGPGADVSVALVAMLEGRRHFDVTVRFGAAVMGGFAFSLELVA